MAHINVLCQCCYAQQQHRDMDLEFNHAIVIVNDEDCIVPFSNGKLHAVEYIESSRLAAGCEFNVIGSFDTVDEVKIALDLKGLTISRDMPLLDAKTCIDIWPTLYEEAILAINDEFLKIEDAM